MKYVIVLGDGMADEPIEAAGGKTPLQLADKPVMDEMAKVSEQGIAYTVPSNLPAGSDVANLSMLGYDPQVYYSGRSPLEALSIGVDMKDTDIALRCNVVTVSEDEDYEDKTIIDHSAGEITSEEAAILIEAVILSKLLWNSIVAHMLSFFYFCHIQASLLYKFHNSIVFSSFSFVSTSSCMIAL